MNSQPGVHPVGSADPHPHPQLALLFYILTFVGAVFNGLTLLILGELDRLWRAGWGGGPLGLGGGQGHEWNGQSPGSTLTPPISVSAGVIGVFTVPLLYRQHQVSVTGLQLAVPEPNTTGLIAPCPPNSQGRWQMSQPKIKN